MSDGKSSEVVITRLIDAPRKLVFEAFTDAKHLARWWGPRGFKGAATIDARVGGAYRFEMEVPDGTNYPLTGVIRELVAPERLVMTQNLDEHPEDFHRALAALGVSARGHHPVLTATFEDQGGKTKLTLTTRFDSAALRDAFAKMGMVEGWTESLERLEGVLDGTADREFVLSRIYDAPRALVFEAFTDAKHLDQWWGPNGFRNETRAMSLKVGGAWTFVMHGPDGKDWENEIAYTKIVKNERLEYAHGANDGAPPQFNVIVTFADHGDGKTWLVMRGVFPTVAAWKEKQKFGAVEGGKQTLARLAAHLAR